MPEDIINSVLLFRKETNESFKKTIKKMELILLRLSTTANQIKKNGVLFEEKMDEIQKRIDKLLIILAAKNQ